MFFEKELTKVLSWLRSGVTQTFSIFTRTALRSEPYATSISWPAYSRGSGELNMLCKGAVPGHQAAPLPAPGE